YTLALARKEPEYRAILNRGHLNLPDGMPLIWLAKRKAITDIKDDERPRGCDVFLETVDRGRELGLRHYLYGGTPDVVDGVRDELCRLYPGAQIVGAESPPFRPLSKADEGLLVERVRR